MVNGSMKYVITENKLNNIALNWMNKNFSPDQLEIVKFEDYPDSIIFKKNGKVVMEQIKKRHIFWFDYDEIWSFFELVFGMEDEQIEEVLKKWMEDILKLTGYQVDSMLYGDFED